MGPSIYRGTGGARQASKVPNNKGAQHPHPAALYVADVRSRFVRGRMESSNALSNGNSELQR